MWQQFSEMSEDQQHDLLSQSYPSPTAKRKKDNSKAALRRIDHGIRFTLTHSHRTPVVRKLSFLFFYM